MLFFFFQAEDGIRDRDVTGVQTCALPISLRRVLRGGRRPRHRTRCPAREPGSRRVAAATWLASADGEENPKAEEQDRSEERRVGKSVELGDRRIIKKKKGKQRQTHRIKIA